MAVTPATQCPEITRGRGWAGGEATRARTIVKFADLGNCQLHRRVSVLLDTFAPGGSLVGNGYLEVGAEMEGETTMTPDRGGRTAGRAPTAPVGALYTPEQRARRDATRWTLVQGILAPVQFLVFAVSVVLVIRSLLTGDGVTAAHISLVLYTIMVTGAIWEKVVFGQYLFAPAFFWEDVVSFVVIALHTLYLGGLLTGRLSTGTLFAVALSAYAVYVVNAVQFLLKLRAARLQEAREAPLRVAVQ
jgi:3-vinyl bacteriochlorophyllide hydratase